MKRDIALLAAAVLFSVVAVYYQDFGQNKGTTWWTSSVLIPSFDEPLTCQDSSQATKTQHFDLNIGADMVIPSPFSSRNLFDDRDRLIILISGELPLSRIFAAEAGIGSTGALSLVFEARTKVYPLTTGGFLGVGYHYVTVGELNEGNYKSKYEAFDIHALEFFAGVRLPRCLGLEIGYRKFLEPTGFKYYYDWQWGPLPAGYYYPHEWYFSIKLRFLEAFR